MQTNLKRYLTSKSDTALAMTLFLADMEKQLPQMVENAVKKHMSESLLSINQNLIDKITRNVLADLKGDKGEKGDKGYTPQKGVDYFTSLELKQIVGKIQSQIVIPVVKDGYTPIPGEDYPTEEQIKEFIIKAIPKMPEVKNGLTPVKGVDYFTAKDIEEIIAKVKTQFPKLEIKATELAEKLNTLEGAIDQKVIRGLRTTLLNIKGGGGKGGGGMGNVQHQHISVSAATTTVTATYKIAGAGYAAWVYYNGALVARGTDYTVGSDFKTLTLLFTPQNGTVVDLIYIRG